LLDRLESIKDLLVASPLVLVARRRELL
jgi:hypothetical protein